MVILSFKMSVKNCTEISKGNLYKLTQAGHHKISVNLHKQGIIKSL